MQRFQSKELQSPEAREDPVKASLRCAKWAVRADHLVNSISKVLRKPVSERKAVLKKMLIDTEFPQTVKDQLKMSRFLTGRLVVWPHKQRMMIPTKDKPGFLTCTVCESDYKFSKAERMLLHLVSKEHYKKCHQKLYATEQEQRQALMMVNHCEAATSKFRECLMHVCR